MLYQLFRIETVSGGHCFNYIEWGSIVPFKTFQHAARHVRSGFSNPCVLRICLRITALKLKHVNLSLIGWLINAYKYQLSFGKKCTEVERVNNGLDVSFGFEQHYIRGLKKMKLRCGIAFCIVLAMALGRIKEKQKDYVRSLVQQVA